MADDRESDYNRRKVGPFTRFSLGALLVAIVALIFVKTYADDPKRITCGQWLHARHYASNDGDRTSRAAMERIVIRSIARERNEGRPTYDLVGPAGASSADIQAIYSAVDKYCDGAPDRALLNAAEEWRAGKIR